MYRRKWSPGGCQPFRITASVLVGLLPKELCYMHHNHTNSSLSHVYHFDFPLRFKNWWNYNLHFGINIFISMCTLGWVWPNLNFIGWRRNLDYHRHTNTLPLVCVDYFPRLDQWFSPQFMFSVVPSDSVLLAECPPWDWRSLVRSLAWINVKGCVMKGIGPENTCRLSSGAFPLAPAQLYSDFKLFH